MMLKSMRERVSTLLALGLFLGVLGLVLWLGSGNVTRPSRGDQLFVVTTIYPLADFVKNVGGEQVFVSNVVPAGAEPHDYEPLPSDVAQTLQADVLVYVGQGLDTWARDLADEVVARGGQIVAADQVLKLSDTNDPHFWLDPTMAETVVVAIKDALSVADPAHAADYATNTEAYLQKLRSLDRAYVEGLKSCQLNDIIISHDTMSYLSARYGFTAHPISGLSPETEPSVKDLTSLARTAKRLGVKTIFFETLVSPELVETLAKEVGAKTAVLNPLEGLSTDELAAGDDYVSVMTNNLEALRTAMLCQ